MSPLYSQWKHKHWENFKKNDENVGILKKKITQNVDSTVLMQ